MPKLFERFNSKKIKDARVLADFVGVFCRENHRSEPKSLFPNEDEAMRQVAGDRPLLLCPDCRKLLYHGVAKRLQCPYDPKPMCKKCPEHCYAPGYRSRMREVMRYSGTYLIRHGRLDLLLHYLF